VEILPSQINFKAKKLFGDRDEINSLLDNTTKQVKTEWRKEKI